MCEWMFFLSLNAIALDSKVFVFLLKIVQIRCINILEKTIDSFHRKLRNIYNSMFSYRGEAKIMKLFVDHKLYLIKKNYSLFQVIIFVMFKGI